MALDILTFGEALVEVMRTGVDQPLDQPAPFMGPYPSGAPYIFTVQAARLGARAACVGCVGDDAFGRCLLDQLRADNAAPEVVHVLPGYTTGIAFIAYSADGSRDYVFHLKQAAAGQLSPALLDKRLFDGLRLLHVTGSSLSINQGALELGLTALEWAQAAGITVSFDLNIRPQLIPVERARETFKPFIDAADVIFSTPDELRLLTGQHTMSEAVAAFGKPLLVVHGGKEGCTVYTAEGAQHVPAYPVEEIDPTGAGDCFDAGFLVSWLAGNTPLEAARFANACGALAVTARGPMAGAAPLDRVRAFMENE